MTNESIIKWPEQFIDPIVLSRKYAPYIESAQRTLQNQFPTTRLLHYEWFERQQPSFMLLPILYLYVADYLPAGITLEHEAFLKSIMLTMEVCAVMDDSIDETPYRSGGLSFPGAYGPSATVPFVAVLTTHCLIEHTAHPVLLNLVGTLLADLGERELWEYTHRFPGYAQFERWLDNRYSEVTPAIVYVFAAACDFAHHERFPEPALRLLAEIFQDVDDVVNIMEQRHQHGEQNDIMLGMVTHPLMAALAASPELLGDLEHLWALSKEKHQANVPQTRWDHLMTTIVQLGVPVTQQKIRADAEAAVAACPLSLQTCMRQIVTVFVQRLDECR